MCHKCFTNEASSGYLTNMPCGEPIFVDYPVLTPQNSCFQCRGIPGPCNPWVNDLFRYNKRTSGMDLDYLNQCPCSNLGPLI